MDLPVIDRINKDNFFSIHKTRAYIGTNIPPLEELTSSLPAVKEDIIMKKSLAMVKDKEKGRSFDSPKDQIELIRDGCDAHRCVYSNKMFVEKG